MGLAPGDRDLLCGALTNQSGPIDLVSKSQFGGLRWRGRGISHLFACLIKRRSRYSRMPEPRVKSRARRDTSTIPLLMRPEADPGPEGREPPSTPRREKCDDTRLALRVTPTLPDTVAPEREPTKLL
jgi:hypothetical protein